MTGQTHFFITSEPISDWSMPRQTLCGKLISKPVPEMMAEINLRGLPEFNSLRDCATCRRRAGEFGRDHETGELPKAARYYLYGIVEGEEAADVPEEAAA